MQVLKPNEKLIVKIDHIICNWLDITNFPCGSNYPYGSQSVPILNVVDGMKCDINKNNKMIMMWGIRNEELLYLHSLITEGLTSKLNKITTAIMISTLC